MEREQVKEKLKRMNPNVLRTSDIRSVDSDLMREGNLQNLRPLAVYQKAKSEVNTEGDYHADAFLDVLLRSTNREGEIYIQAPDGKTDIHIYSKEQIEVFCNNANVETWFKTVKSEILEGRTNLKAGHFISLVRNYMGTANKVIELNIKKAPRKNKKESQNQRSEDKSPQLNTRITEIDDPTIDEK
nr:unnamed protein product [Callosobruchus analis]